METRLVREAETLKIRRRGERRHQKQGVVGDVHELGALASKTDRRNGGEGLELILLLRNALHHLRTVLANRLVLLWRVSHCLDCFGSMQSKQQRGQDTVDVCGLWHCGVLVDKQGGKEERFALALSSRAGRVDVTPQTLLTSRRKLLAC